MVEKLVEEQSLVVVYKMFPCKFEGIITVKRKIKGDNTDSKNSSCFKEKNVPDRVQYRELTNSVRSQSLTKFTCSHLFFSCNCNHSKCIITLTTVELWIQDQN